MNGDKNRMAESVSTGVVSGAVSVARPQRCFEQGRFNKLITGVGFVLLGFSTLAAPGHALAKPTQCASLQQQYRLNQEALKLIEGKHVACAKAVNPLQCNKAVDEENEGDHAEETKLMKEMRAIDCPLPKS
jgi:hypothetical protein